MCRAKAQRDRPNPLPVAIDNGEAERAIRPLAVGRANWLHVGGLKTASVLN